MAGIKNYSNIAKELLPQAHQLHDQGLGWKKVAQKLRIGHSTLWAWLQLERLEREQNGRRTPQP